MSGNEADIVISGKSSIAAELHWTRSNLPPEVTFSYDGLDEPAHLWEQLESIGWIVPPRPPRPSSAIDWTPDPVAGTDYTILPWRAQEFQIEPGEWAPEEIPEINERTFAILKQNRVAISGPAARIEALDASVTVELDDVDEGPAGNVAEASMASPPVTSHAAGDGDPTHFIFLNAFEPGHGREDMSHYIGTAGRQRTLYVWSEAVLDPQVLAVDASVLAKVDGPEACAWALPDYAQPHSSDDGHVRILMTGATSQSESVHKLVRLLGADATVTNLQPVGRNDAATLLTARVPSGHREMLIANVRLRFKDAIVRDD